MANQLQLSGAQTTRPVHLAPIFTNRFFQGLWTQRNPLRDAGSTRIEEKFYGARGDAMIAGSNTEISNRLTPTRRPGLSVYNSSTFTDVDSFYEFRQFSASSETITVMVDTPTILYNGTGPSTKTAIWMKSAGAGQTFMQSVGNTLYFGDGVDQKKWMQPGLWVPNTAVATSTYDVGTTVIDSNGNLEYLSAYQVGTITTVAVTGKTVLLTFLSASFSATTGMSFTPSGLSGASFLNGNRLFSLSVVPSGSTFLVTAYFDHANYASSADFGTATTTDVGTPATTGASVPAWSGSLGGTTADGLSTWTNYGTPVFNWGVTPPTQAPALSPQNPLNGNGITAASLVIWQPFASYAVATPMISDSNDFVWTAVGSGPTSGRLPAFEPPTVSGNGSLSDGGYGWTQSYWLGSVSSGPILNGPQPWAPGKTPVISGGINGDVCVDSNGNLQQVRAGSGPTGSSKPAWNVTYSGTTTDNGLTWTNVGPWLTLAFTGWEYGYSYHAVDGSVSTLSPLTPLTNAVADGAEIGGVGSADPQVDSIWIFRTTDGGATPLFLASIPNPGGGAQWSFFDQNPDSNLDLFLIGPQAGANNPPPTGLVNLTYHLGRVFGSVDNVVFWSGGPDTVVGNGSVTFPAVNSATFPSRVSRIVPTSGGAIVFTISDIYIILGQGTTPNPLFSSPYATGIGLLSYNALAVNGTTIYLFTSDSQVISLDPSSGISQVGFPIGDQFQLSNWSPATAYVTWHVSGSQDHALYVADGSTGWFRMTPTAAPESGLTWSPFATITGGAHAVQSVEVSPGLHQLLVGSTATGPILKRDLTVWTDNGTPFPANFTIGSLVLAQPGQIAELSFLTTDALALGGQPVPGVLIDEVSGNFESLLLFTSDPPQLPKSTSTYNQRFYFSQTKQPALCRHLQIQIAWPAENFQNELLSMTLFGGFMQED
jgi:hypothetical protein